MNTSPTIRLKRSLTAGSVPSIEQLTYGELAINHYDGTVFVRQDTQGVGIATRVVQVGAGKSIGRTIFVTTQGNDINLGLTQADALASIKKASEYAQPGDTIKVGVKIVEGKRERIQYFEGVCIAKKNRDLNSSFTVRKISFGEGVERTFALYSPNVASINVIRSGKVRRAKLYYLRDRKGKSARIAEKIKKKIGLDVSVKTEEVKLDQVESTHQEAKKEISKVEAKKPTSEKK